jgi:membrane-associated phospholipid phosphatase
MNVPLVVCLTLASVLLIILERRGLPVVLALHFKGDIKRESRWFAQYGQAACTLVAAGLVWRLDSRILQKTNLPCAMLILVAVFGVSIVSTIVKRLLGRVRPGREDAGKFLGFTWQHANHRESFPSSHSACAIALSLVLARLYPAGAAIFWTLAILCAALRYLMDAHWPSDVLAGIAVGYAGAALACQWMGV